MGFVLPGFWPYAKSCLHQIIPGLAVAFLLLIAGNYVAGLLIRPLRMLKEETEVASKATDDWQLELVAHGEIAEIARNWNSMVDNFHTSYQQVIDARRELEVRNRVMLYEKKRTEAIIDGLTDGVVVIDAYGKINFVNRECENLLGINRSGAIDHVPQDVITDDSVLQCMTTALGEGGREAGGQAGTQGKKNPRRVMDTEITRKNGARHIRVTHVPVADSNGSPGGAIFTLRDITQEKLEERARKEFVSSVTHELRAPLTAIKSYVEMLIDDEAKDPNLQRDFFNTINEEADRLARLIDDMLNMSKIEVGNLVLNKSLVRTRKLVEDAVNGLRSAAKSKSIDLSANLAANLPDVEADKELVRVVITNLLGNGVKYTQDGGRVFLNAEMIENDTGTNVIAVSIEDNGPGIPEDELDKIFEKFYRGRATANQKVMGNGLGLALAREIATLHGGDIKVTSTVGQGSKFTFLLPAAATSRKVS
jgi:two-component system phosphate regulon sensor histidine kinase PhoR